MENQLYKIPSHWSWVTMGEISEVIGGGTPKTKEKDNFEKGEIPWLTPADLSGYSEKFIIHGQRNITEKGLITSSAKMIPEGTVLFTSRAPIGYVAIAKNSVCTNQGFKSFVLHSDSILPDYVYWYLKGCKSLAESFASGTTFLELSGAKAKQIPIPIAPINEQKRIVAEIEKLFSRLDEAVENLNCVKANLKRYKASILKAAVEGKLTEEWRKNHPDVEPADKLLERILAERRKKWEESELAKMKAKGKAPIDDKWKKKYKEPLAPEIKGLTKLPEKWKWCSLGQLIQLIKAGKSFKCNERPPEGEEIGVVKVSAVSWGEFNELESKTVTDESKIKQDYLIHQGDFLFSRANTIELVGACVIVKPFNRKLMLSDKILRLDFTFDLKRWCLICLRTRFGRNEIESLATGNQESMRNISQANIMKIRLPLPPFEEQKTVIKELEHILSQCEMLDKICDANLKRADRLRQSILKKAFSGRLVPQKNSKEVQ